MKTNKEHQEVYILGSETGKDRKKEPKRNLRIGGGILFVVLMLVLIFLFLSRNKDKETPEYFFEPEQTEQTSSQSVPVVTTDEATEEKQACTVVTEETAHDVQLRVYTPHNATMSLVVGMPDKSDTTLVFAAMAADIRKDNMQIVGDFVLDGKRLARGVAKKGFAAIIDNKITIGIGETTPLLQQAIERQGSFFRQYPLVFDGEVVENRLKNRSIRRALAVRDERVVMVESKNRESLRDFSRALIEIGVSDAIYLVGGDAFGWYYDSEHVRQEFGRELTDIPKNISYIIWK